MPHIMVIDDEGQVRKALKEILEFEGYTVATAANGKEGVELCQKQPPDLVVTDIIMPVQEGLETIVEIKQKYPNAKIIAISGGGRVSSIDYLGWSEKLGAGAVFSKPIDFDELLKTIKRLLGK